MTNGPWNLSVDISIIPPGTVTQDKKKENSLKHQIEFTADLKRRIGEKKYFDYFY